VLASSGMHMAKTFQWIATLAEVESEIVDCFHNGGGVPYDKFTRFHDVMADESEASVVSGLHEHVMPLAPGIVEKLEAGIDVLDIGCGSGRAMCELARQFPRSRFTGYDICDPAVEIARANARAAGVTNLTFETRDVTGLHDTSRFDLVTAFDVIHDQRDPAGVLDAVRRVLKPGATFLMQDIRAHSRVADNMDSVLCPFFYTISTMHCMTVSLAQGGAGLGTVWGEELAVEMLNAAGFEDVVVNTLDHDIMNNWYVMRTPGDASRETAA
jgi:2-polyprenyl-3-methyl-5-hydroxy-6-metoxy-1,4-benzoquinol methylase